MAGTAALLRGVAGGALGWSATEYAVHRWVMHGPHTANPITAEHLDHHRDLERTDPLRLDRFLLWPLAAGLVVGLPVGRWTDPAVGLATGATFAACYCGYRQQHWAIHHRPARTRWGRSLRRHHLRHHVGSPRSNHGVTSPLWDVLLRTRRPDDGPVLVPSGLAPSWLHRPDGSIDPQHARDVRLR